jgi:GTP cyclohydrolase I
MTMLPEPAPAKEPATVLALHREMPTTGETLTWTDIKMAARSLARRQRNRGHTSVYGVPTGGAPVAVLVAEMMGLALADRPGPDVLIVDDLIDTGRTLLHYLDQGLDVDALYRKPWSPPDICPEAEERNAWLRFPWEREEGAPVDAVLRLLQFIGEDPTRDGLLDTPRRVVKSLTELTGGYRDDVEAILSTTFDVAYGNEMVVVSRVPFSSLCEHHMLPFTGFATVGYVPSGRVVGLSKLARLVDAYARRLQVQERMTMDIAEALVTYLDPVATGVIVEGTHSCMSMRGIKKAATFTTSSFRGTLETDVALRAEFSATHRV